MSLADQIIDGGPYAEGDTIRAWMLPPNLTAAALNALRDELLELRRLRALLEQFEVGGNLDDQDCDISLTCHKCSWHIWIEVSPFDDGPTVTLAELVRRAGEHTEDCP